MRFLGLWSGHDCSFAVLNDGKVEMHTELERHLRQKEPAGDSIKLFFEHYLDSNKNDSDFVGIATCHLDKGIKEYQDTWAELQKRLPVPLYVVGHHQAHAANAFYSSNFDEAIVVTLDGGGIEDETGYCVGASVWHGKGTKLDLVHYFPLAEMNIGGIWSRVTRHVFKYESGWPQGNQAGTTMALAALAKDSAKYIDRFRRMFGPDLSVATARAPGHVKGMSAKDPKNPKHPYLNDLAEIAEKDEQAKYDMAGALQQVTEEQIFELFRKFVYMRFPNVKNVCFTGGVSLNSVAMGKLASANRDYSFFIPPVPYDGGLTIGAAQYAWHHVLGNPRIAWSDHATPYLGKSYSREEILNAIKPYQDSSQIELKKASDDDVIDLLDQGDIISVFNGRAESGRRALGSRSILADPRNPEMKDKVNHKVKHRQWFRPFAPSVLRESVKDLFVHDMESPYMGFVLQFKDEVKSKLPAVVHFDGTARLQTVTANDNPWYHSFLSKWKDKTGFGIILNTSFNDREPITETPHDAISCFLGTEIDYLYFPELGIIVGKKI